jgi:hypothetical protein
MRVTLFSLSALKEASTMNRYLCVLVAMFLLLTGAERAQAEILDATSLEGLAIDKVDTTTNSVTTVFNAVGTPDSLVFDSKGDILYHMLATPHCAFVENSCFSFTKTRRFSHATRQRVPPPT